MHATLVLAAVATTVSSHHHHHHHDTSSHRTTTDEPLDKYLRQRAAFVAEQDAERFDAEARRTPLTAAEARANQTLVSLRDALRQNMSGALATPIRAVKSQIEDTELFRHLHAMPKGAMLHVHSPALNDNLWFLQNATYRPGCYVYWEPSYELEGRLPTVADTPKGSVGFFAASDVPAGYLSVAALRAQDPTFDAQLLKLWDVLRNETRIDEKHDPWGPFGSYFGITKGAFNYLPVLKDYLRKGLLVAVDDWKVSWVELRSLGYGENAYVLNATGRAKLSMHDTIAAMQKVVEEVKQMRPGRYHGSVLIYSQYRKVGNDVVRRSLEEAVAMQAAFPNFVVGYDLVGDEDAGRTLRAFAPELVDFRSNISYYFHAGETDWLGSGTTGANINDAVLLETKRIGHGLAMAKLPLAAARARQDNIVLEVCPVSNQALQFVLDTRDHPASSLLMAGVPITINNDDPALLDTVASMGYDYWLAFVGWDLDLASLKQLTANSITYATLPAAEKAALHASFSKQWAEWVSTF